MLDGGYEPIAARIFQGVRAQRLLLEYDDERSGSFQALKEVPEEKMVVLGLVSSKTPRSETREDLGERIREASQFISLERLALSTQCGFASSVVGNRISEEDQKRKLALVTETARDVWKDA